MAVYGYRRFESYRSFSKKLTVAFGLIKLQLTLIDRWSKLVYHLTSHRLVVRTAAFQAVNREFKSPWEVHYEEVF